MSLLDIETILDISPQSLEDALSSIAWQRLGESREGRPVQGCELGHGPRPVSLIAGCHADEPVGPAMLDRLAAHLASLEAGHTLLTRWTWYLIPHVNPDGEARNAAWTSGLGEPSSWCRVDPPVGVNLLSYLQNVARESPGDDVEFGFPRPVDDLQVDDLQVDAQSGEDHGARPEARAVANFLARGGPYVLHGSFHGMAFAAGPWFLIEASWAQRTEALQRDLVAAVESAGYRPHDIDRQGDKGFTRISRGFTTRPDSRAMAAHFEALGKPEMAALFRPSSMEFVRRLGGDPLTLVSEMPLFLLPAEAFEGDDPIRPPEVAALRLAAAKENDLSHHGPGATGGADSWDGSETWQSLMLETRVEPMPLRDQMRFQLAFLEAALEAVDSAANTQGAAKGDSP